MNAYPLSAPDVDHRFTKGLVIDVAQVLEEAGYPKFEGGDYVRLQQALFNFLYETTPANMFAKQSRTRRKNDADISCSHQ